MNGAQVLWLAECANDSKYYKGWLGHTHVVYAFGGGFSSSEMVGEKQAYESFYEARDAGATRIALVVLRSMKTGKRLKKPKLLKSLFLEEAPTAARVPA